MQTTTRPAARSAGGFWGTKAKLALIALLALVLAFALWGSFGATPAAAPAPPAGRSAAPTTLRATARPEARAAGRAPPAPASTRPAPSWPPVDIERLVALNPFVDEPAAPPEAVAAPGEDHDPGEEPPQARAFGDDEAPPVVAEPKTIAATAIITGRGRPAALVGERLVYEDDVLEGGWRVIAIAPTGIVVAPTEQEH